MCVHVIFLSAVTLGDEEEIWEMTAAWVERDWDTMTRARILALTEAEAEERKTALPVFFGKNEGNPIIPTWVCKSGCICVCFGTVERDKSVEGGCEELKREPQ